MTDFLLDQLITESVELKGFELVTNRPLSLYNKAYEHLRVVLAKHSRHAEFAVWIYDASTHILSEGLFTNIKEMAYNDFYTRV
ncbi:hypothetical protein [Bacillus phage phiAGATE]|uniref:Uncharacterized protein n=1 Tax=Bacillus phage phiAGATE TaxID=1204533 RepID=L0LAC8_9CAUD|nr:hypothetical protein G380_gp022 [Bacillus phage phiAGATE]AGB62672.1 hypothetical protein [Bacillus phage phiAGATE]